MRTDDEVRWYGIWDGWSKLRRDQDIKRIDKNTMIDVAGWWDNCLWVEIGVQTRWRLGSCFEVRIREGQFKPRRWDKSDPPFYWWRSKKRGRRERGERRTKKGETEREEKEDQTDDRKMMEGGEGERDKTRRTRSEDMENASDIFQHRRYVTLLVQTHRSQSGTVAHCGSVKPSVSD